MSDIEYASTQQTLVMLASIAKELDLGGFLQAINHAETVGPILDPTLYMRAGAKLQKVRDLATSLLPFVREVAKQTIEEESANGH